MPKPTAAEIEQRVNAVYMLLMQSEPREKILLYGKDRWDLSAKQIDRYIAKARKRMQEALNVDRDVFRGQAIAQRNDLYRLAYKEKKWFTCLQILDSRDRILGLFEDINTHIEIVEGAGYAVRNPALETEDSDPVGQLFAEVEAGETDPAEGAAPDAADGVESDDSETV